MRRLVAAAAVVFLAAGVPARAEAAEEPPTTYASLIIGAGQNVGDLGDRYLYGFLAGTEAGFHIRRSVESAWDVGAAWSFMWGYFPSSSGANVDDVLTIIQLEGIGRGRLRLPGPLPFFARAEVGIDLYRASLPIPPENDQLYLGPTAGGGFDVAVSGWVISIGARYGLFAGGPTGLRLMFGIGKGSR